MIGLNTDLPAPQCSRAGCHGDASWRIEWRNPRIHAEDRVKVWLACDEHRDFLHDYLAARDFPVSAVPFDAGAESAEVRDGNR